MTIQCRRFNVTMVILRPWNQAGRWTLWVCDPLKKLAYQCDMRQGLDGLRAKKWCRRGRRQRVRSIAGGVVAHCNLEESGGTAPRWAEVEFSRLLSAELVFAARFLRPCAMVNAAYSLNSPTICSKITSMSSEFSSCSIETSLNTATSRFAVSLLPPAALVFFNSHT